MVNEKKPAWMNALKNLLKKSDLGKSMDQPDKLEYYRNDLNVDLPPVIRDLMLNSLPDLVLQPKTENHILEILAFAREYRVPLTLRGAGTWGYGGAVPTQGGILIDLGLMDTIEVNPEAMQLSVGPGARFLDIGRELDRHGLILLSLPSGKGGTLAGWISTGGMGFGTFHHGSIRKQLTSLRVALPDGTVKELKTDDPEIGNFLSTEGQMGILIKVTLKVGKRPSQWYPFIIPFQKTDEAYAFARKTASHPSIRPDDLVIYHSELVRVLKSQSDGGMASGDENLVLTVFSEEAEAKKFEVFLSENKILPGDGAVAKRLWDERFLPMSIKNQGPSLLATEVVLPIDQVASYHEKINEWGKRLGLTFYPTAHLIDPENVLFLALITTDHRKLVFYADLMLVPMMVRLAVQFYHGKPYGLGIWNTPFLKDLYSKEELNN
jgi:glycolate oxidase